MKYFRYFVVLFSIILISCGKQDKSSEEKNYRFVTTSKPLAMILQEIAGEEVLSVVPTGASPHTFAPKPSDARIVANSLAFFYVSKSLDGWAEEMDCKNRIEVFRLLPQEMMVRKSEFNVEDSHNHSAPHDEEFDYEEYDPHFWTDPMAVKAILPKLLMKLSEADPGNSAKYKTNAEDFALELDKIDSIIAENTKLIKSKPIFLFHPSFLYLIKSYGLTFGGSIEWNPGEENTPAKMANLIKKIKSSGVTSIFSEPQLPNKSALVLADETGTRIFKLDPLGGEKGRKSYYDLMIYNSNSLKAAFE